MQLKCDKSFFSCVVLAWAQEARRQAGKDTHELCMNKYFQAHSCIPVLLSAWLSYSNNVMGINMSIPHS